MNEGESEHYRELLESAKRIDHLCDDFERAWLAGERPSIEEYLDRVTQAERPQLLRELLQVELDAQLSKGDRPDRNQYVQRFPECATWIDRVLNPDLASRGSETIEKMVEPESPAVTIEGFRVLRELSRGGQAVVYQAIQLSTKRKVAIKVLSEGPFRGMDSKRRFEREIALVGGLRHPGIVSIFDSGISGGRYFYAMEYIRGQSLNRYVNSEGLALPETLRLFSQVCDAVDYAHQRGVIHRDLKPSNILVDDRGDPHVLDFGLAKIAGGDGDFQTLVSQTGQIVGTPAYMSPEQAAGRPDGVDMRSDVYALGVILYELLTGRRPYDVAGPVGDVLHTIQHTQPKRPSLTGTSVNSEVETIVLKALDKQKDRRYDTAGALRRDIQRYLAGQPIEAKRDSALYVLRKTLGRYRAATAVAATILLIIAASTVAMSILYTREITAREKADREAERATRAAEREVVARLETAQRLYVSDVNLAAEAWENADLVRMFELLNRHRNFEDQGESLSFELRLLWEKYLSTQRLTRLGHNDEVRSAVFSLDGKTLVTLTGKMIRFWDVATRRVIASHTGNDLRSLVLSPDGETLASGSSEGRVILWDFATRAKRAELEPYGAGISQLAFSSDGKMLVAVGFAPKKSKVWDVGSGKAIYEQMGNPRFWGLSAVFSKDSKTLFVGTHGAVQRWDVEDVTDPGSEILSDGSNVRSLAVSSDGKLLAIGGDESVIRIHDIEADRQRTLLERHLAPINCGAFSPNGQLFASGSSDRTIRLWDVETGHQVAVLRGHTHNVICLAFSPKGTTLASGGGDRDVILWNVDSPDSDRLTLHQAPVSGLAMSSDATKLASTSFLRHPSLVLWDVATRQGEVLTEGDLQPKGVALSPTENKLVAVIDTRLRICDLDTHIWTEHDTADRRISGCVYSPDGKFLATPAGPIVRIWSTETWGQIAEVDGPSRYTVNVAFSPSGRLFATPTGFSELTVYDAESWEPINPRADIKHDWPITGVAFSPDGKTLATVCMEGQIKLWDAATLHQKHKSISATSGLIGVAFSPDGDALVGGGIGGRINIWNLNLKQPELVASLRGHDSSIRTITFSGDGRVMATASYDGTIRLWRTASHKEIESTRGLAASHPETDPAAQQQ